MNINKIMKQAQAMQQQMEDVQGKMAEMEVEGSAGGGMIKLVMNGQGEARKLSIDPKIIDPDDPEMLEDLIVAAINDTKAKVESTMSEEMAKVTSGLSLPPGMKLPF